METTNKTMITIEATVNAPVEKIWKCWLQPEHIVKWNAASDDWHTTKAEADIRVAGKFSARMEAKDGSMGFDFGGHYVALTENKYIEYQIGDGREVKISFTANGDQTKISESFEAESMNPVEMQKNGWQAILDNFKKYVETTAG